MRRYPQNKMIVILLLLSFSKIAEAKTMSKSVHINHTIDYIEFPVTDMEKSKDFYSKAFGWEFNDYGPNYAGIKKHGGGEVGGFSLDTQVVRGGVLIVLYSTKLEYSLEKVKKAGGLISKEIFSFPGGRRFQLLDPNGNELAVWSDR